MAKITNKPVKVYLYQWVNFDDDYNHIKSLGRLGGNNRTAGYFRAIESDAKDLKTPQWIIAARRKENNWGIIAILRARSPVAGEQHKDGKFDKYLLLDNDESVLLVTPNEDAIVHPVVNQVLNKVIGENTRGENGKQFEIPYSVLESLLSLGKVSIRTRVEQLLSSESTVNERVDDLLNNELSYSSDESVAVEVDTNFTKKTSKSGAEKTSTDSQSNINLHDIQIQISSIESEQEKLGEFLSPTEINSWVKRRIGQGPFRAALLEEFKYKCAISGLDNTCLLIASHIRPWSECDQGQHRDTNNGLLLSVTWDALFDKNLISFNDDGTMIISELLDEATLKNLGISETPKLPENYLKTRREYLKYHRNNLLKKVSSL